MFIFIFNVVVSKDVFLFFSFFFAHGHVTSSIPIKFGLVWFGSFA